VGKDRPDPEILFGRIALMLNYINSAQLTECVLMQEKSPGTKLGTIMMEQGYLTPAQLNEVITVQQTNLQAPSSHPEQRLEDTIIGRVMVRNGFATEEQVNEALRTQGLREQEGVFYRLGEVMVEKGYMSVTDVLNVLKLQDKQIMVCPGCGARFNVASFQPGRKYRCKKCKALLSLPATLESVEVDTTIFMAKDRTASDDTPYPVDIEEVEHPEDTS
jgi:hypothetical protein